jgi:hypothetical protein
VLLAHKKLCQAKMGPFGKKLEKHFFFFLLFCSKKDQNCVSGEA